MNDTCANINYKNAQAQHAARESTAMHMLLHFKDKVIEEKGFVLRIVKQGIVLLVPKYGLESIAYFDESHHGHVDVENQIVVDEQGIELKQLDKVDIRATVVDISDYEDLPNLKMDLQIVSPPTTILTGRKSRRTK